MDNYMTFIALSRYARWLDDENRRETWEETVLRYINFFRKRFDDLLFPDETDEHSTYFWSDMAKAILELEVMPSMRALMTAGPALDRDNMAQFNCTYIAIDDPRAFDEMMYILMCGTGVGFSVERQYVSKLPEVADELYETNTVIKVKDSKIGWASSLRELISLLYSGRIPVWDLSKIRPSGARLKTFGGRASGPEPLDALFKFCIRIFKQAIGRRLTSLECHDLCCKIADVVVVGGVRRSALISLSNLSDDRMRRAKMGQWWEENEHRALANNSACYTERPDFESFLKEWVSMYESRAGERGIFSRVAARKVAERNGRRDVNHEFGTNPCSEIILRPNQGCNLSEAVIRSTDTLDDLKRKVRIATILGTMQATLTKFRYLRPIWRKNTEEEALLGVSLTGIMDHPTMAGLNGEHKLSEWLRELRIVAVDTNAEWAAKLGINQSTAITCCKPSGTVSQLVDSASGIHPRFSPYYIRRVRADAKDPLAKMMQEQGVPCEEAFGKPNVLVFSFPMKAPKHAICTKDVAALDQLELWKIYQDNWCEHKPSITVYYKNEEFLQVGQWVWDNFDIISGISFLPYSDHIYKQAPYEEITEEQYATLLANSPEIMFDKLGEYEKEDNTKGTQTLSCSGGVCDIVDLI